MVQEPKTQNLRVQMFDRDLLNVKARPAPCGLSARVQVSWFALYVMVQEPKTQNLRVQMFNCDLLNVKARPAHERGVFPRMVAHQVCLNVGP